MLRLLPLVTTVLSALAACGPILTIGHLAGRDAALIEGDPLVRVTAVMKDPGTTLPEICSRGVTVRSTFDSLPSPYQEIAFLTASAERTMSTAKIVKAQVEKAARLGANAIIVDSLSLGYTSLGDVLYGNTTGRTQLLRSTAIYVAADSQRVRLACQPEK